MSQQNALSWTEDNVRKGYRIQPNGLKTTSPQYTLPWTEDDVTILSWIEDDVTTECTIMD